MVWVFNPAESTLWLISHKDIYADIELKALANVGEAIKIIDALERVCRGEEPEDLRESTQLGNSVGEPPELLLKAYKWIWGQEDSNYPTGQGRKMSMNALRELRDRLTKQVKQAT